MLHLASWSKTLMVPLTLLNVTLELLCCDFQHGLNVMQIYTYLTSRNLQQMMWMCNVFEG